MLARGFGESNPNCLSRFPVGSGRQDLEGDRSLRTPFQESRQLFGTDQFDLGTERFSNLDTGFGASRKNLPSRLLNSIFQRTGPGALHMTPPAGSQRGRPAVLDHTGSSPDPPIV